MIWIEFMLGNLRHLSVGGGGGGKCSVEGGECIKLKKKNQKNKTDRLYHPGGS